MSNPPLNAALTNHGWGVDIVAVLGRMRDAWRERKPNWVEMPLRVWGEESKTSRVDYWHYSVGYPVKKKVRFEDIGPTVAATPYVYTAAPVCKNKDLSCYFKPVPCSPPDGFDAFHAAVAHRGGGWSQDAALYETRKRALVPHEWLAREVDRRAGLMPIEQGNCAVLHVRRSDTALNKGVKLRRNMKSIFREIPLLEYLEKGKAVLAKHPSITKIFMITDDQAVIDEAGNLTANTLGGRSLVYLDRPRFRGAEGGWENHFPSKSALEEVITIMVIEKLVVMCDAWLGTKSTFMRFLLMGKTSKMDAMLLSNKMMH